MAESPDKNSNGVLKLTISTEGNDLKDDTEVVLVEVCKKINKIPNAKVVLLDGNMPDKKFPLSDSDDFKPGNEIEIKAGYGSTDETIFKGVIIRHGLKIGANNTALLEIDCRDPSVAMTVARKNANYVDVKDSDIIATLIGNYSGLSQDIEATTTQYKELVQYYCSDWDFMLSRAEVNGLLVCVDDGKLTVKPPQTEAAELKVTYGEDLIEFQADLDARMQLSKVKGVAWDVSTQAAVEAEADPQTINQQGDLDSAALAAALNISDYRLQTATPLDADALKGWAEAQQLKSGLSRICGHMKFQGSAKAKVGSQIEVEGVGSRFSGNVYVSAVYHYIENGDWVSETEFGLPADWFAETRDLTAPSAAGLLPGVDGLQVGVVKKLDEDPEDQCRIQVSVPVLQAESEGVWARLIQPYASSGFGMQFIPEIGDEVVLGYFNNDPSNPVILGSLYSSGRKPPYDITADNFIKAAVTREALKLEFDDENKVITLLTPGANTVVISDKDKSILLQDQNGNKVELGSSGITLDSPKDISITAKGGITLDAVGAVSISSKQDVKVEGLNVSHTANVGFTAKGNATAELSASGQTTVKGAMVMIN